MEYHLAHVNIARMRGAPGDPTVQGLTSRVEEMNRLAEESPGFVWRLPGAEATPEALRAFADYLTPFEPQRIFYNMSVWKTVEDLRHYVYRTRHAEMVRDREAWIEPPTRPALALWWVPKGERPSIEASAGRLRLIERHGSTPFAFTLEQSFAAPTPALSHHTSPAARVALFQEGLEAFSGRVFPVGQSDWKVVRLLLSSAAGCDVHITPEQFQVRHGNLLRATDYYPETIPSLMSQLLAWSKLPLPAPEARALLDPTAAHHDLPKWLIAPRLLWMRAEPEQIRLAVRDGTGKRVEDLAGWPEPSPAFAPRYFDLAEPLPCPLCGAASRRYRKLFDQSLVCGTCGRSFVKESPHV